MNGRFGLWRDYISLRRSRIRWGIFLCAAVLLRGHAGMRPEQLAEIRGAAESALQGDGFHGHVAVAQQLHGAFHPVFQQVAHRGGVKIALEAPRRLAAAYAGGIRYVLEGNVVGVVRLDKPYHLLHAYLQDVLVLHRRRQFQLPTVLVKLRPGKADLAQHPYLEAFALPGGGGEIQNRGLAVAPYFAVRLEH